MATHSYSVIFIVDKYFLNDTFKYLLLLLLLSKQIDHEPYDMRVTGYTKKMRYINKDWEIMAQEVEEARKAKFHQESREISLMEFIGVEVI